MVTIAESGVTFGHFIEDDLFHVETSLHVKSLVGIKVCEFVWWSAGQRKLVFIEAKSSVPNPQKNLQDYENYFAEIYEKLENSLQLLLAASLSRPAILGNELRAGIASVDWQETDIQFYLVIPRAPKEYLPPLSDKLTGLLRRHLTIWNANAKVINEELARIEGLLA